MKLPTDDRWPGGAASEVDRRVRAYVARFHASWTTAHMRVLAADEELRRGYVEEQRSLPPRTFSPNRLQLAAVGEVLRPEAVRPPHRKFRDPDELRGRNMIGKPSHNKRTG